jgi:hypothetical protein
MRLRFIVVAMGLSLALCAARANDSVTIAEIGETGISATFNGQPLSVTVTGPADNWTIELPSGFSVGISGQAFVGEPENFFLSNVISFTQPTFMIWESEVDLSGMGLVGLPSTVTLVGAGVGPTGTFDLVLADSPPRPSVADGGATAMLLTAALSGLGLVRRFARS